MIDLRKLADGKYRVGADESASIPGQSNEDRQWLTQIPARYGHVFIYSRTELGAYCSSPRVAARLAALPGVRVRQRGSSELSVSFAPDLLGDVAEVIGCRRRRRLSDAHRRKLAEASAPHRFAARF